MKKFLIITFFLFTTINVLANVQPYPLLSYSVSVKANAMGNSYNSLVWDVFSTVLNPAVNGVIDRKNVGIASSLLYENTVLSCISYLHPTLDKGNFAVSIVYLGSYGAKQTDEYNRYTRSEFGYTNILSVIGWGKEILLRKLYIGGNIKFLSDNIDGYFRSCFTTSIGGIYKLNNNMFFASNINNLLSLSFAETKDILLVGFNFGFGIKPFENLSLGLDVGKNKDTGNIFDTYSFGLEYTGIKPLSLRAGRNNLETTFGFGVNYKNLELNYATVFQNYLGFSHRIAVDYKFGKTLEEIWAERMKTLPGAEELELVEAKLKTEEEKKRYFQSLFEEAVKNYTTGNYKQALANFNKAKEIYPDATDIDIYIEKIKLVSSFYPSITLKDKISKLLIRGINFFVKGDNLSAVKVINYASSLAPQDTNIARLLSTIEEKTGVRAEKIESPAGTTIVDKLHNESLIAFRKRDYATAVKLCEEILLLEPEDVLAYKRLGSAFYAMGEKDKAIQMWEQALKLDPKDEKLRQLVKTIKK
jgi:tetratricopeptide (TPR) repeat protein